MNTNRSVLVTGVTGATGSATARALAARGIAYRGFTRRDDAPLPGDGTVVRGDFDDRDAVARALEGVGAAYLVTPSTERAQDQQLAFLETAREAGVAHIVLLSQFAAAEDSPVRFLRYHAVVEAALRASGMASTALRPNLFMQGLLVYRDLIRAQGIVPAPIGDARVSAVHVDDIGAVAAHALVSETGLGVLDLTGPAALTHAEMASALARAAERDIRFVDVPAPAFARSLGGLLPAWQVEGLLEDYAHYAAGEAERVSPDVEHVTGRPAHPFAAFAAEAAPLLR